MMNKISGLAFTRKMQNISKFMVYAMPLLSLFSCTICIIQMQANGQHYTYKQTTYVQIVSFRFVPYVAPVSNVHVHTMFYCRNRIPATPSCEFNIGIYALRCAVHIDRPNAHT